MNQIGGVTAMVSGGAEEVSLNSGLVPEDPSLRLRRHHRTHEVRVLKLCLEGRVEPEEGCSPSCFRPDGDGERDVDLVLLSRRVASLHFERTPIKGEPSERVMYLQ